MASDREKAAKAFRKMKSLGILSDTVKPVLKKLFKLYNGDWRLIEEDNYRSLADAIFEAEEDKLKAVAAMIDEEVEPPFKKPHTGGGLPEDQGSSNYMDNKKAIVEYEVGGPARSGSGKRIAESSESFLGDVTMVPDHLETHAMAKNKGFIEASQNVDMIKKRNMSSSRYNHQITFQTTHDIAASTCGQVKVSLTCNRSVGQQNFHHPNADAVLHFVEAKYRKVYMNLDNPFSMVLLLNELCESYLKMGADSFDRSSLTRSMEPNDESDRKYHPEGEMGKRAVRKACDITNGTEKVNISILDESGNANISKFTYIPENTVYQSAYVVASLARISDEDCCSGCKGNCISSKIPCGCARETGGEFAYTFDGLLSERFLESCISLKREPQKHQLFFCNDCPLERAKNAYIPDKCKGHLLRKFIKECWRKCGCNMLCGNRVVQRGISRKLQVFFTNEGKGWGVRTLEKLPAGAFICEYAGEILTNIELYERNQKSSGKDRHTYPVLLDADWATESILKDEDALCLDATYYGNVSRFFNHRCFDGNLVEVPVQVENPDRHYYHLAFFTKMEVDAFEELTWDYGIDFDDHYHPIKAFECRCGSQYCRGRAGRILQITKKNTNMN